jgi:hypothetical protein
MASVGDRVVVTVQGYNAYRGRRSNKNRVSLPAGTVGVVVGHTRMFSSGLRAEALRVRFPHTDVVHTVFYNFCSPTKVWPGQMWMSSDGESLLVLEFSHFPREISSMPGYTRRENEFAVWWCLIGERRSRVSETNILQWEVVNGDQQ